LIQFGFDLNFLGPKEFLDRYLLLLSPPNIAKITSIAHQILILSQIDEQLLNYRPSQLAACAAILALNIFMIEQWQF